MLYAHKWKVNKLQYYIPNKECTQTTYKGSDKQDYQLNLISSQR